MRWMKCRFDEYVRLECFMDTGDYLLLWPKSSLFGAAAEAEVAFSAMTRSIHFQ